jgi:hypothetical protein
MPMMRLRLRARRRSERGAVAILFAVLVVVLFGLAALGVDIAQQVNRKHLVIHQLDAASTAAAAQLGAQNGSIAGAVSAAMTYYAQNGEGELDPANIDFWCVVARELQDGQAPLDPPQVAPLQIPTAVQSGGVCNPDGKVNEVQWFMSSYQARPRAAGGTRSMTCSATLCAVPCALNASESNGWNAGNSLANGQKIRCNTIRVGAEEDVPFSFAPAMGIDQGSTGTQISVACAGSCGSVAPNPMDVVVVADRTLSMTEPLACTLGSGPCRDYRKDLVDGIKSMLEVMTPEQQYVALGALGPSERVRSTAESNACNATQKGLVYPSDQVSTTSKGSWVPMSFKNDYLGAASSTGTRAVNPTSKLIQAVNCLDDVDSTRETRLIDTRTALASPLKAAARYLLGKSGDENNVAALGGGSRSGTVRKVLIFETDGEPYENATTTSSSALTLDNRTDIFSKYTDFTDLGPTSTTGPALGNVVTGTPRSVSPAPPSPYDLTGTYPTSYRSGSRTYTISYRYRLSTTTTWHTRAGVGGQNACENFKDVADLAKAAGILVITIGYNLDATTMCSGSNDVGTLPSTTTTGTQTPWVSDIQPTSCRNSGGNGSQGSPYTLRTSCASDMTMTYTVPQTSKAWKAGTGPGDASVTSVLADASGGPDVPVAESTGCTGTDQIAAENSDEDLFFCAAKGQDLAPLFVTALSKVTSGVKLMRLPQ